MTRHKVDEGMQRIAATARVLYAGLQPSPPLHGVISKINGGPNCSLLQYPIGPKLGGKESPAWIRDSHGLEVPGMRTNLFVRYRVFVEEQGCKIDTEYDKDDHTSVHCSLFGLTPDYSGLIKRGWMAAGPNKDLVPIPVACIRIQPGPHKPHPMPGSVDYHPPSTENPVTQMYDGKEVYVKLGRLAVIENFRRKGLAHRMVEDALTWLSQAQNWEQIRESGKAHSSEKGSSVTPENYPGETTLPESWRWNGLVCAYAQVSAKRFWANMGFQQDPELGEWVEEGMPHIAMWKRLERPANFPFDQRASSVLPTPIVPAPPVGVPQAANGVGGGDGAYEDLFYRTEDFRFDGRDQ